MYPALALTACLVLASRLVPDIRGKPLHQDEALATLISARPLAEIVPTVMWDRGGAPLHFVLSHLALAVTPSTSAVRLMSAVLAVATVAVCWDIGRRLDGHATAAAAAVLAATSQMLGVYGSFGRMYSLFAFAAAASVDLFVRAVEQPGPRTALAATVGALLLPASHPYGGIIVAAEAVVALALWRGRPLRPAVPALVASLAFLPFLVSDLRLADRFSVSTGGNPVASPDTAARLVGRAIGGFAGGAEPVVVLFLILGGIGAVRLTRRCPAFVTFAGLSLGAVVAGMLLGRTAGDLEGHLATRHLVFALPFWVVLAGCGAVRLVAAAPRPVRIGALVVLGTAALLAPQAVPDPRTRPSGSRQAIAAQRAWLEEHAVPGAVLFPASPVFAGTLEATRDGYPVPREQPAVTLPAVRRAAMPVPVVLVAVPLDGATVDRERLPAGASVTGLWVVLEQRGPFTDTAAVLRGVRTALDDATAALPHPPPALRGYLRQGKASVCGSLLRLGKPCLR